MYETPDGAGGLAPGDPVDGGPGVDPLGVGPACGPSIGGVVRGAVVAEGCGGLGGVALGGGPVGGAVADGGGEGMLVGGGVLSDGVFGGVASGG